MLRTHLEDAAIAAAKSRQHAEVERRHVLYAIARHFREHDGVGDLLARARERLDPVGSSAAPPIVSKEAAELLASLKSDEDALHALSVGLGVDGGGTSKGGGVASGAVREAGATAVAQATATAPPSVTPEDPVAVLAELDGLVGLDVVKQQLRRVVAVVQANAERERAGLPAVTPGLHLVFTGPPGTGKTTVARLVARLYAAVGALPGSNFTEATRADLVAGYVGQTAIKTDDLIRRTRPGVLFIDEAYSLTPTHESDFGAEALAALVKAMEDHRDDFAVIMAGYGDETAHLIESNPGLRSRFKTFIEFPPYTPSELTTIFEQFAAQATVDLGDGVRERVLDLFEAAHGAVDLGSARHARSVFEEAYARMAARAAEDGHVELSELRQIEVSDVSWEPQEIRRSGRRVGFETDGG